MGGRKEDTSHPPTTPGGGALDTPSRHGGDGRRVPGAARAWRAAGAGSNRKAADSTAGWWSWGTAAGRASPRRTRTGWQSPSPVAVAAGAATAAENASEGAATGRMAAARAGGDGCGGSSDGHRRCCRCYPLQQKKTKRRRKARNSDGNRLGLLWKLEWTYRSIRQTQRLQRHRTLGGKNPKN